MVVDGAGSINATHLRHTVVHKDQVIETLTLSIFHVLEPVCHLLYRDSSADCAVAHYSIGLKLSLHCYDVELLVVDDEYLVLTLQLV